MRCGVLALQGGFAAHQQVLRGLGVDADTVRTAAELERVDALVIPGGESSAVNRLLALDGLGEALTARLDGGMPVLATCCGVILLARGVEPAQETFGCLDVDVVRNAYGRQLASTVVDVDLDGAVGPPPTMEGVFIRSPRVTRVGPGVRVLGRRGEDPVLVATDRIVAATFHPELTDDPRVHEIFITIMEAHDD